MGHRRIDMARDARKAALLLRGALTLALAFLALACSRIASGEERIFVADQTAGTVHQYSLSGDDLGVFASGLVSPSWITFDSEGNICVSDYTGRKVTKFSPSGDILLTVNTPVPAGGVRVGSDGTIYIGDYFGDGVLRYSAVGDELAPFVTVTGLDP